MALEKHKFNKSDIVRLISDTGYDMIVTHTKKFNDYEDDVYVVYFNEISGLYENKTITESALDFKVKANTKSESVAKST